jgi:hypothetical protein
MNTTGNRVKFEGATSETALKAQQFQAVARSNHAGSQTPADGSTNPNASSAQ